MPITTPLHLSLYLTFFSLLLARRSFTQSVLSHFTPPPLPPVCTTKFCSPIGVERLFDGWNIGLNNQRLAFFTLTKTALELKRNICLDGLVWSKGYQQEGFRKHDELWDLSHWNFVAEETHSLPRIVRKATNCTKIELYAPLKLHIEQKESDRTGIPYNDTLAFFFYALRPHKTILAAIRLLQPPQPYAALHLRAEVDVIRILRYHPPTPESILNITFSSPLTQKCISMNFPTVLHIATNLNLLRRNYLSSLMKINGIGNENKIPLHFVSNETYPPQLTARPSAFLFKTEVVQAIIDYYICLEAETFFVGNREVSTFSSMILLERTHQLTERRENAQCSFSQSKSEVETLTDIDLLVIKKQEEEAPRKIPQLKLRKKKISRRHSRHSR